MNADESVVRIETVAIDSAGRRQIGPKQTSELLKSRSGDIKAAILQAWNILSDSASSAEANRGWQVSSFEATFGVTLTAEAGALISKVGAEASLEITLSVERRRDD